jgi:hypothetical protein
MITKRILSSLAVLTLSACSWGSGTAVNPDPNHTHADFAVWINGQKLDFSDERYMSAPPADETSWILKASAHGDEDDGHVVPGREYLHLHDGNGHVLHSHKPGQTIGQFFGSLGMPMTPNCFDLDDFQFATLDPSWVRDFARTKKLCDDGKFHWTMMVNGARIPMNPDYALVDLDTILLSYGASDTAATEEYAKMTDDACLYSKTCPERGDPPTENCIADPTVPCVQ